MTYKTVREWVKAYDDVRDSGDMDLAREIAVRAPSFSPKSFNGSVVEAGEEGIHVGHAGFVGKADLPGLIAFLKEAYEL